MLTREDWTKATGAPSAVKGLAWYTDGSKTREGTRVRGYGQSVGQRLSFSLGRYATVFQVEIYAILACVHEVQSQNRLDRYVSICSDSLVALKALKAVRAVIAVLTGHNTLRRHLYLLELHDSPLCSKCGVGEENLAHILCECESLASFRHVYLGSFFLEAEDIKSLGLGAIWNYCRAVGLP